MALLKFFAKTLIIVLLVLLILAGVVEVALKMGIIFANPIACLLYFFVILIFAIIITITIHRYVKASVQKNIESTTKYETTGP